MTIPQCSLQLPYNVTGNFSTEVVAKLSEEEKENLRKFVNLYFLGDEIADPSNPDIDTIGYREAIARTRCDWPIVLSLSFDHNSMPCIKIKNCDHMSDVEMIQKTINCSIGCAEDIWSSRKKLDWSKEAEDEIIALHNAGVPSTHRLLKD